MANVLVVDDEENIQIVLQGLLENIGHSVQIAGNATDAYTLIKNQEFDVILSDIIMPGLTGIDLLTMIRKEKIDASVIVMTGEPTVETASEAVRQGAFDYLAKPIQAKLLQKIVNNAASFKALKDEKKKLEKENLHYQKHLEKLVEIRTEELTTANKQLQNAFDRLNETLNDVVQAMSVTIEKRDPYTAGHQFRVAHLSRAISIELDLERERSDGLFLAALIHDIGKIAVPAEILSKPSGLCAEEFQIIKRHPQTGHDILQKIKFPWPIAKIVLQHHERLDGSGYPAGLKKDEILLEARIIAVADVIESMASHRPYRPELGIKIALDEIRNHKATLYDENVADACLTLFEKKGYEFFS